MNYKKIQQTNKKLQKQAKSLIGETKDEKESVFIRHWNVLCHLIKGKDISDIENPCDTPLYSKLLIDLSELVETDISVPETTYLSNELGYKWMTNNSKLYSDLKKEFTNE